MSDIEARIAALLARQHGIVDLVDLDAIGLSGNAVRKRLDAGRLHRIHIGVYSPVPVEVLSRRGRWLAAVRACGRDAVLSHRAAAVLHELHAYAGARIDVTVAAPSARRRAGIELHGSVTLAETHRTVVDEIPVTTVSRTLVDLAVVVTRRALERAFEQAEIQHRLNLQDITDQLAGHPARHGSANLRAVLDEYTASAPTESELEERFLALIRRERLPVPEVQAHLLLGDQPIRVDFLWRPQRLVVETDGHATHRTRQAVDRDSDRDQRLLLAGWRSIRVRWRQLTQRPDEVAARLRVLLG